MAPLTPDTAYRRAAAACARREYCRQQWTRKFTAAGLSHTQAEEVADKLEDEGFICESRYARAFTLDKVRYDRWGRIKIAAALREKGIAPADIAAAAEEIDQEEYLEALRAALRQKARSLHEAPPAENRARLVRHAASRGYEPDLVWREAAAIHLPEAAE